MARVLFHWRNAMASTVTPEEIADLKRDEGCKLLSYPDPLSPLYAACRHAGLDPYTQYYQVPNWRSISGSPWTVAYGATGHDVVAQMTVTQGWADQRLSADAQGNANALAALIPWVENLDPVRMDVLRELSYNLGVNELVHGWPHFITDVQAGKYLSAAQEITSNHVYVAQAGQRATRLANMMQSGHR